MSAVHEDHVLETLRTEDAIALVLRYGAAVKCPAVLKQKLSGAWVPKTELISEIFDKRRML